MDFVTVLAFSVGLAVGGISCGLEAQRGWRRVRRETTEQMKRSLEIQDQFYAAVAMCHLSALRKVEAGDMHEAGREIAFGAANFYHHFCGSRELSRWIQTQKDEIELHARKSEVLRAALARKPNESGV